MEEKNMDNYTVWVPNKHLPGLNPLSFGNEQCEPLHYYAGTRPYWLLHFVVSGKGAFAVDDRTYKVSSMQCFIVRPNEKIFYQADEDEPWHYIWIAFTSDIEMPTPMMHEDVLSAPSLNIVFSEVLEAKNKKNGQQEYLSAKSWEIVSYFCTHDKSNVNRIRDYVERAKTFIESDFNTGITVADIAKQLNLDRSYFSTMFKKNVGISPQEYLNEYRLSMAAKLLISGQKSVSETAYATGYTDIVNFSRMFKKHFGISPSEYKKSETKPIDEL